MADAKAAPPFVQCVVCGSSCFLLFPVSEQREREHMDYVRATGWAEFGGRWYCRQHWPGDER